MFGQEDYILQHTNVSCHMPVNVYYEPSALYEVKRMIMQLIYKLMMNLDK